MKSEKTYLYTLKPNMGKTVEKDGRQCQAQRQNTETWHYSRKDHKSLATGHQILREPRKIDLILYVLSVDQI